MLSKLVNFGESLTLVPDSGIQFVEYGFDLSNSPRVTRNFIERPLPATLRPNGEIDFELIANWDDDDPDGLQPFQAAAGDNDYSITKERSLEPFLGQWLPVPFLRIGAPDKDGNETYERGPQDWVRMRVIETREAYGDTEATHRVTFAFDTSLVEHGETRLYLAPTFNDASQSGHFRFVHRISDVGTFLKHLHQVDDTTEPYDAQAWVRNWIRDEFREFVSRKKGNRRLRPDDFLYVHEPIARYLTLLDFISRVVSPAKVSFINAAGNDTKPIDVDLVLDIGNSRSCGILIQTFPEDTAVNLNNSLVLELRDLTTPELVYRDPFESHLELVQAEFGRVGLLSGSNRRKAFFWPSLVRIGKEAARYRRDAEGTEAMTGMSSPKRYLWDTDLMNQFWRFRHQKPEDGIGPLIAKTVLKHINKQGDVLDQIREENARLHGNRARIVADLEPATQLRFSRSSFFTFMLLEVIAQAMMMMNSPASRQENRHKDAPRRLRRIVLTIPSATPIQEQRIIRSRAEAAVKLLWALQGWDSRRGNRSIAPPTINASWDEASSMHMVYLYGEITQKLGGSMRGLLDIKGRPRILMSSADKTPRRSLRIASIDIGGGTCDLMVTTYFEQADRALIPQQEFREGFRKAGDDLLREVIQRVALGAIRRDLEERGASKARDMLAELFAGDRTDMSELDKHRRREFVLAVLQPVALGVLEACEAGQVHEGGEAQVFRFGDFFGKKTPMPGDRIVSYLTEKVTRLGVTDYRLADIAVRVDPSDIAGSIETTFSQIFANLAEAVHHFDSDVVLLTGRPSRIPQVSAYFINQLAVTSDRIVPVSTYRVGNWYPFREQSTAVISDPKTTAVVGGMLCALSEKHLMNFTMYTDRLSMKSTARYIGELDLNQKLTNEKVLFSKVDLDNSSQEAMTASFNLFNPVRIGYRQLPYERWVASPLYKISFDSLDNQRSLAKPIKVTLERADVDKPDDDADQATLLSTQAALESFRIESAEDANGRTVYGGNAHLINLKLDTLAANDAGGYWLDTGILSVH